MHPFQLCVTQWQVADWFIVVTHIYLTRIHYCDAYVSFWDKDYSSKITSSGEISVTWSHWNNVLGVVLFFCFFPRLYRTEQSHLTVKLPETSQCCHSACGVSDVIVAPEPITAWGFSSSARDLSDTQCVARKYVWEFLSLEFMLEIKKRFLYSKGYIEWIHKLKSTKIVGSCHMIVLQFWPGLSWISIKQHG